MVLLISYFFNFFSKCVFSVKYIIKILILYFIYLILCIIYHPSKLINYIKMKKIN